MSDVRNDLGERIRQLRKAANLTQAKLAEAAGICAHYAGQIERAEVAPSLSTADDLASALGITLSDLVRFPSQRETPEQIINQLVRWLLNGDITSVEDLNLLNDITKRIMPIVPAPR